MNRQIIRRTLLQRAGGLADAGAIADATLSIWADAALQLAPVIGAQGADVLFRRSLHITSKTFPWLAVAGNGVVNAVLAANLQARLAGREAAVAIEASEALLVAFTELLASLIGSPLTEHLLAPIWALPSPASKKERAS